MGLFKVLEELKIRQKKLSQFHRLKSLHRSPDSAFLNWVHRGATGAAPVSREFINVTVGTVHTEPETKRIVIYRYLIYERSDFFNHHKTK